MEVKAALSGFLAEFNAFQSDIKAKLQEQETRLAMLDRKSIAHEPPAAGAGRRDRDAAQEGLRRLSAVGRRRRAARPDRRGEGAVDGGGGGRRLSGRSGDGEPDRRGAALVGLDPDDRQRGEVEASAFDVLVDHTDIGAGWATESGAQAETGTPQVDRDLDPAARALGAAEGVAAAARRLARSTSRAGWRSGSPTSSAAPRRRPSSAATASTSRRGSCSYPKVDNDVFAWGSLGYVPTGAAGDFSATDPADAIVDLVYSLGRALPGERRPS